MLRRHIVLLIAIRPSDGDVKPDGTLFREEQAENFLQYTIQILIPHVMWSPQAVRDLKIDTLIAIYPPCVEPEASRLK